MSNQKNYAILEIGPLENVDDKIFVGQTLGLTGCEMSVSNLAAGESFPFVHAHKMNEELFIIIKGRGTFYVDGEEFDIREGSLIRVAPAGERVIKAGDVDLIYICVQAQDNSLTQATRNDGFLGQTKASWM